MATDRDGRNFEVLDVRRKEQGHNLDWLRRLGMHVWFEQRADDSLRDSFISYNKVGSRGWDDPQRDARSDGFPMYLSPN